MNDAYQLKPWVQVAIPHADVIGNVENATFAASLGAVIRGEATCAEVYRDARKFFEATYLTKELKGLLNDVLTGLGGGKGDRVLQLRTPFGGGKTHSLVSLYHITHNRHQLAGIEGLESLADPGEVQVLSFIGADVDAAAGATIDHSPTLYTPWGYLAWQLGGQETYRLVEEQDKRRIAPGNDILRQLIGDRPTLILIDEFLVYVQNAKAYTVGDSNLGQQVLTFIQKLTEVVRELPRTVLVYSLQVSVQEAFGDESLLNTLDKLVNRIDAKKEPVTGDDVLKVIQRRLFTSVGDGAFIAEVANQQAELYYKYKETFCETERERQEAREESTVLADRIRSSYPFHPDLLDLMYHRWGTLPSYQRTRGALQFLAHTVHALWKVGTSEALIGPGSIPIADSAVKQSFFSQVGERDTYNGVLSSDITGTKAKAKAIDSRIAGDAPALAHLKLGTRLATAILMYSFGARGDENRGALEPEIALSCLLPGLDRTLLTATLSDLRDGLLYLHYANRFYRFETQPNLNKLIADEENKVGPDEVSDRVRSELEKAIAPTRGKAIVWPADSSRVGDGTLEFSVIYCDSSWATKSQEMATNDALQWLEYRGSDKREYKNAIAFVLPSSIQLDKARAGARSVLAIDSLLKAHKKYGFKEEQLEELTGKKKNAQSEALAAIRRLYEGILLPVPDRSATVPIRLEAIDLQSQLNTSSSLQERVLSALSGQVFDSITVAKIVQLSGLEVGGQEYIKVKDLIGYFFKFPNYPKLLNTNPIKKALLEAIAKGKLGYTPKLDLSAGEGAIVTFGTPIPEDEFDPDGYILLPELVERLRKKAPESEIETTEETAVSSSPYIPNENAGGGVSVREDTTGNGGYTTTEGGSISKSVLVAIKEGKQPARHYTLEMKADKSKVFDLFEILQNLSDRAESLSVSFKVTASTTGEFDPNWLRGAIEEPLDEMNIKASVRLE